MAVPAPLVIALHNLVHYTIEEWELWCQGTTDAFVQDLCVVNMPYRLVDRTAEPFQVNQENQTVLQPNSLYRFRLAANLQRVLVLQGHGQVAANQARNWLVYVDRGRAYLIVCTRRDLIRVRCAIIPNNPPESCQQYWNQQHHANKSALVFVIAIDANERPGLYPIPVRLYRPIVLVTVRNAPQRVYLREGAVGAREDLEGEVRVRRFPHRFNRFRQTQACGNEFESTHPIDAQVRYIDLNTFTLQSAYANANLILNPVQWQPMVHDANEDQVNPPVGPGVGDHAPAWQVVQQQQQLEQLANELIQAAQNQQWQQQMADPNLLAQEANQLHQNLFPPPQDVDPDNGVPPIVQPPPAQNQGDLDLLQQALLNAMNDQNPPEPDVEDISD